MATLPGKNITDQGMVYITLGAPKQRLRYNETRELKPMEIWFYQSPGPALPAYFYLIFFKESAAEDFRLYSPYIDHPQKLVNSLNAINDDPSAIKLIQRDINDEAAHVALSLIPGEPVDLRNPSPTLDSDVLLNNIRNFRNLPQNRDLLNARKASEQSVSHRLLLAPQTSALTVMATRDSAYTASIHYLMSLLHPGDLALRAQNDGSSAYSLELHTQLTLLSGKVIYSASQALSDTLSKDKTLDTQKQQFGLEGRIPVGPGTYKLTVTLRNLIDNQTYTQDRTVLVPAFNTALGLSQVFFAANTQPLRVASPLVPFSFEGVRLSPLGAENASLEQGSPLRIIMQVWEGARTQESQRFLNIHYLIGKLNQPDRHEEEQEIDKRSFDASGNLLIGRDLPTKDLSPGSYRLVIKVTDPDTHDTAYQSLNFTIGESGEKASLWTLLLPPPAEKNSSSGMLK